MKKIKICSVASADITLRFLLFSNLQYLKKRGFEVWAISSDGKWIPEIRQAGISVKTIPITRRILTPFTDVRAFIRLILLFRKERFDIVHTHTLKASFVGQLAAFVARVPIRMYTIHGLDFENNFSLLKKAFFVLLERVIALLVHRAFSVNREDTVKLLKMGIYSPEKLTYLPLGIDLEKFNPARFSEEFCREKKKGLAIPLDAKVIGIVARFVREKGYLELFDAFDRVLQKFPGAVLIMIGAKEPAKSDRIDPSIVLSSRIGKNVRFLGERINVEEFYAIMDVFVLPTYREGLGISILEASAMERPVVATAIRGCREAAEDGKTAILVPPRNVARLVEAIEELFLNPEKAKALGKAGRQKAAQEFNQEVIFETLMEEYERLIREKLH